MFGRQAVTDGQSKLGSARSKRSLDRRAVVLQGSKLSELRELLFLAGSRARAPEGALSELELEPGLFKVSDAFRDV